MDLYPLFNGYRSAYLTLRRLLDARAFAERQRVARLLQGIQSLALIHGGDSRDTEPGLELDLAVAIESPFRRSFWVEPPQFEKVDLTNFDPSSEERRGAFQEFASLKHLDWKHMRHCIRRMLNLEHTPTLGRLLEIHPVASGIVEVLGYIQIAHEDGHLIDATERETILIPMSGFQGRCSEVTVPRVTFVPPKRTRNEK